MRTSVNAHKPRYNSKMDKAAGSSAISLFNDCISRRDLDGLSKLMTEDHVFVDAANNVVSGKERCLSAWRGFFAAFPDYRNVFQRVSVDGAEAVIVGYSTCSDSRLAGPALWTARIEGARIAEWRVYEDTPENRAVLNP
jgi:ketosteroid isomerase-like protein